MRIILFCLLTWCCASFSFANPYFKIVGPTLVQDPCGYYQYTIESDETLHNIQWHLWDGSIPSSGQTIYVTFGALGVYYIFAQAETANGEQLSDTIRVEVFGTTPQATVIGCYQLDADSICYQVCANSTTIIEAEQGVEYDVYGALTWDWPASYYNPDSIGGGIEITWGPSGTGRVIVYHAAGCVENLCFELLPEPDAAFGSSAVITHDTITVCQYESVSFYDQSINNTSVQWDFADGTVSTFPEVTHQFTEAGYQTVSLTAKSICECEDIKTLVIHVLPTPTPSLDCVNSICPGTRQRYTATTDDCTVFHWTVSPNGTIVNGGGPNDDFIEVIWYEGPDGIIELAVEGCASAYCIAPNEFRIPIITPDGPISGDNLVCPGDISTYTVPYFPGTEYVWTLGGFGNIQSGQYTHAIIVQWDDGNIAAATDVRVQYDNCFLECGGEAILPISFRGEIELSGDKEVCENGIAEVRAATNLSSTATVQWHIENAAGQTVYTLPGTTSLFTHTYSYPPGLYAVVATHNTTSYCNTEVRHTIRIIANPAPPLGISGDTIICPGNLYGFTIEPAGHYATRWTVYDGTTEKQYTGENIAHAFGSVPPFEIQAFHADIQFQTCVSNPISLTLDPLINHSIAGPADVCLYEIQSYTIPLSSGVNYQWEIIPPQRGEIRRSDNNTVDVFWTEAGTASLRLTACGNMISMPVTIHALPAFNITGPTAACFGELVTIATDQPAYDHTWLDANHQVISVNNTVSLYPGAYAAVVTDNLGCIAEKTFKITSYPSPEVNLSTGANEWYCNDLPAGITIAANTDGSGYTYTWFHDDINVGTGGPIYNVTDFGSYHVAVTNTYGCTAVSQKINFENCCPPVSCDAPVCENPGCTYIPADLNIDKDASDCNRRRYQLQYPGVEPGSVRWGISSASEGVITIQDADVFQYPYALPGYYTIMVISRITGHPYGGTDCGHIQVFADTIRAVADFKAEGRCASNPFVFEDLTTFLPGETIVSWSWNFNDPASGVNNISSLQNPTHTFSATGIYAVRLVVTMASGCTTTKTVMVDVSAGPSLVPVYEPVYCEGEASGFSITSGSFDVAWNFGDASSGVQNTATTSSALHTFDSPGLYTINVAASDVYGCRSQQALVVDIRANTLSGNITEDPNTLVCFGESVQLTAPPGGVSWQWSTSETTASITTAETGTYLVTLTDPFHCTYTPDAVDVEVAPAPDIAIGIREIIDGVDFGPWDTTLHICYGTAFELQAFTSMPDVTFHWFNGSTQQTIQFTDEGGNLPMPGLYEFSLYGISEINCTSDTVSVVVEIYPAPAAPVIALTSGTGCGHNDNVLTVTNPASGIRYVWSNGQEGSEIITTAAGDIFVTALSAYGCTSESNIITIKPGASVDQIPGGCYLKCDPLTVCLPSLDDVVSYNLYRDGVLIQSGTSWPDDYMITSDGSYVFDVTLLNGCIATSEPLNIELYTGVGSITVLTYFDTDGNGVISAGDALLSGMPVDIISDDGTHSSSALTSGTGSFAFLDFPATTYTASFDPSQLPSIYDIVIDSVEAIITTCDDSVVVALLVRENCTVTGPDQYIEICMGETIVVGDSLLSDTGSYEIHMTSVYGCDSSWTAHVYPHDSIEIHATVWVDVDKNGIVSAADTVIEGITIMIDRGINQAPFFDVTDQDGKAGGYYLDAAYMVSIDSTMLPTGFEIIIGQGFVADSICLLESFNFLIGTSCANVFYIEQESICQGDSVEVQGQWITAPGQYSFILNQPGTCDTILDVLVDTFPLIRYTTATSWSCISAGSLAINITGAGPFFTQWTPALTGDSLWTGLPAGDYGFIITDNNGCTTSSEVSITNSPVFHFSVDSIFEVTAGESVIIPIHGDVQQIGLHYQWSLPGILDCDTCAVALATPIWDTTMTILITDSFDCVYALSTAIIIREDSTITDELYVPNVFTPNGDGINDHWTMFSRLPDAYVNELDIYDRWGTLLFSKANFLLNTFVGWDGTFRGQPLNPAVFAFTATVKLSDGSVRRVKGDITLVR